MATVFDVADYVLSKLGPMTTMKLQKLIYYSQAWSLVWDEKALFNERIEAWANGPVVPALFQAHRGQFQVSNEPNGDQKNLTAVEIDTVDAVIKHYGQKSGAWLSDLTHREDPWLDARDGLDASERSNRKITNGALADYYGNL